MTRDEFSEFITQYRNIWGVEFDESKIQTWYAALCGLKKSGLIASIIALSKICVYPAKIKEIVDKYDELRQIQALALRESREQYLLSQTRGQNKCPICCNSGIYIHCVSGYNYLLRCSCPHGRDLNRWSKYQITRGMTWTNPNTGKIEDLYIYDVDDVLTREELDIAKLKNTADAVEKMTPEQIRELIGSVGKRFTA